MTFTQGFRIGPYEILSELGAGGMGEVCRARDLKLQRDVAIKVLPIEVATDVDRLARFSREAQDLASLNHPNIAAIHGLEESGETSGAKPLLDGPADQFNGRFSPDGKWLAFASSQSGRDEVCVDP